MKKMISILTVLVLSIVTMLPVKVMAAEYPHKNSEVTVAGQVDFVRLLYILWRRF